VFGAVQPLTPQQLAALSQRLSGALGSQVTVAVVRAVQDGANMGTHFVAIQNGGPPIGMKASDRGVPDGNGKERLVAEVAVALALPNACQAAQVAVSEIPALSTRDVNAIKWLENSVRLADLQPAQIDQIRLDPRDYLFQYGQWMALGLLLGVRDRHTLNWVWAPAEKRLAMIDNEDCLGPPTIQDFYAGIDRILVDRSSLKSLGPMVRPGSLLAAGLRRVQKRYRARRQEIDGRLAAHGFAVAYKSSFMDLTPKDLAETVFSSLT
jgi:hypothetical protein